MFSIFFYILLLFVNNNNGDYFMKNYSIWKEGIELTNYNRLDKNMETDVLIIGGGMTGVNTFYQLNNSSLKVLLVEQNKIGYGVTVNSTGKLTYLQDSLYEKINKNFDKKVAKKYLDSQREAINLAVGIINKESIDCNLLKAPSYVYSNDEGEDGKLKDLKQFLEENNIEVIDGDSDLIEYKSMIGVEDTYIFHPLKYINGLVSKIDKNCIYENTSIQKIDKDDEGYVCFTDKNYKIRTKWVVIASHYPYFNLPFLFPIKGSLEKSYLSASKYREDNISLIKYSKPIISIRSYLDYLLCLSNSRNISSKVDDKAHYMELKKKLEDLGLEPEYMWSNTDIMTNDGLPYVGEIKDKLLMGTGYNTWGMTNGILAGKILADIILGNENKYVELFYPKRNNLGMIGGSILDGYYSATGYLSGYFNSNKKIEYKEVDGKEIAIYKDEDGVHKVYTKCPHMGCYLIFNEIEKTWDCPCHASRFDLDGKCISGPANEDISYTD